MKSKSKELASCVTQSSASRSSRRGDRSAQEALQPARFFLGLGSNLGDRCRNLAQAVHLLARAEGVQVLRRSSLYESAPIGPPQPRFLNAVVEIRTTLSPAQLLRACKAIETALGREDTGRWGPRLIDIDLLLGDAVVAEPLLQVPHLMLHKRAFALIPLLELHPEGTHPVLGASLALLLQELAEQDLHRVGEFYVDC